MLWSELRLNLKTSSVAPDFFYVFYRILSFSTVNQSFKKICVWEVFGRERAGPSLSQLISTNQTDLPISPFANTFSYKRAKNSQISIYFLTKTFIALCHAPP